MKIKQQMLRRKQLSVFVGLALSAPLMISVAQAAPANLPVNGQIIQGSASTTLAGNVGTLGAGAATLTVALSATANVINWGNSKTAAPLNPNTSYAGFNIGTGSAVNFTTTANIAAAMVLNVDQSGQPSALNGTMTGTNVNVFVANANGIVVGSQATLTAPVLGLIAANVNNSGISTTTTAPSLALDFTSAGSVSVANGANLNGGNPTNPVLIAGANQVNVAGTSSTAITTNLTIVGGASGIYNTDTNVFTGTTAASNNTLSSANTTVNLNLGTSGTPFTVDDVYAIGNIVNTGDIVLAGSPQFTGTFTNNGYISNVVGLGLTIGGTTTNLYNNSTIASAFGSVVNNGTITAANGFNVGVGGSFTNSSNGSINVTSNARMVDGSLVNAGLYTVSGNFNNIGGAFSNSGTLKVLGGALAAKQSGNFSNNGSILLGSTTATSSLFSVSDSNFSNTGTLSLMTATTGVSNFSVTSAMSGTLAGTFSASTLDGFTFSAGTNAGNVAEINTQPISATTNVNLSGYNITVNSSVAAGGSNTVTVGGAASPQLGVLSIGSSATLSASANNSLSVNAYTKGFANVAMAGDLAGGEVTLGGAVTSLNNIQGAGTINSSNVEIYANGNVNNPNGGGAVSNGWLKNGLLINPGSNTGTVTVSASGPTVQYWNLKVLGNASYQSVTNNFTTSGLNNGAYNTYAANFYGPAANAGSHLIMTAEGNMEINGRLPSHGVGTTENGFFFHGVGTTENGFFFPGMVVAVSSGNMTVLGNLNNAWSVNAPAGNGILLNAGKQLAISGNVYTNGGSLVNYWAPDGVTLSGLLYSVVPASNTSTGVYSYFNTPYLYSSFPGANASVGGAREINLLNFVK